jgi:glycosyltransferase involved in cell wall biosynthesis
MNPMISIVMSVYNNEKYLKESIESILQQSYSDFEFIITNDASFDKSFEILQQYALKDERIILINNLANIGLTKSLNNMLEKATGKYIARMDGDDIAVVDRLEKQVNVMEVHPEVDLVFSDTFLIDQDGEKICKSWRPNSSEQILKYLSLNNFIPHPTVMIKTSVLKSYKYNENFKTGQDADLWERLHYNKIRFYYIKDVLLFYRLNPDSVRNKIKNQYYNLASQAINNNYKKGVFKYFDKLTFSEKIVVLSKLLVPFKLKFYKGIVVRKFKKGREKK